MDDEKKTALGLAREYFDAWRAKNFEKAAACLSEAITFEMPINSYKSKAAFMNAVKLTSEAAHDVKIMAEFGDDHQAMLLYDMELQPIGNLRIAEHLIINKGKIKMIRHVHDTAALRKAGFVKDE